MSESTEPPSPSRSSVSSLPPFPAPAVPALLVAAPIPTHIQAAMLQAKDLDLYYAKKIAGLGQMSCFDAANNINVSVWAPHLEYGDIGHLVQPKSVEKEMWDSMHTQLEDTKHMVKQLKDLSVLPNWMLEYAAAWESAYREKVKRTYDIGQPVLTAMHETMFEIRHRVSHEYFNETYILTRLKEWIRIQGIDPKYILRDDELVMRFLFRNKHSSDAMCHIAGAILQKSEVCSKPGSYAATRLWHDLTIKVDMCIRQLLWDTDEFHQASWLEKLLSFLEEPMVLADCLQLLVDHTTQNRT